MNKALISGKVDGEVRENEFSGGKVCNFSVLTVKKYKDNEFKSWHRCTAWNDLADVCSTLTEGDSVFVEGEIQYKKHEGVLKTTIKVDSIEKTGQMSVDSGDDDIPF